MLFPILWHDDARKLPIFIPVNPEWSDLPVELLKHHQIYYGMSTGHGRDRFACNLAALQSTPPMSTVPESMADNGVAHLLSWDVLMPTSLGMPLKYEMSRAARELEETRLLRAPHMLTTTSQDGVFWCPSLGSFDTNTFTTLVAAKTEEMGMDPSSLVRHLQVGAESPPTHVVFVGRVSGEVSQEASQRPQLHLTVGV